MEPIERWVSVGSNFYFGRTASGKICVALTDGASPSAGGTIKSYANVDCGHWGSLVLNMTQFDERPNDWHAFMDHHHGRRDLLDAAKENATLRNVVRRQTDALHHAKAAMESARQCGIESGAIGAEVLDQVADAIISGERVLAEV